LDTPRNDVANPFPEVMPMTFSFDPTLDPAGYADCVLDSADDYEPYGCGRLELQPVVGDQAERNRAFDWVIEAQILADSSMVGC
jgi:hypothetical protein